MTNVAATLRLGHSLRHRLITHRRYLTSTHHSLLKVPHLGHVHPSHGVTYGRLDQFKRFNVSHWSHDACATRFSSCMSFSTGQGNNISYDEEEKAHLHSTTSMGRPFKNKRKLTNMLLAINVLVYTAQLITDGDLLTWGAKVNSLIDKGELWRLVTCNFLHSNLLHLMLNCCSLDWIGPIMEDLSGPKIYLAIYMTSAVACSTMSYWFCQGSAVGASGAIFGLVGSYAVYLIRHKNMVDNWAEELWDVVSLIAMNLVGGLIGGIVTSWLIGPAWKLKYSERVLVDKAPIFCLLGTKRPIK